MIALWRRLHWTAWATAWTAVVVTCLLILRLTTGH